MRIIVRDAEKRDVSAIARVHVASWHETYRGILPDGVIAARRVEDRERLWGELVEDQTRRDLVLAEAGGDIVGFGASGPARDALLGTTGEIFAIYVLKRWQFRGIGSTLMGAMASALSRHGLNSLGLWVARDNVAAIAFYQTLGGALGRVRTATRFDFSLIETAVVWDDSADLSLWDEQPMAGLHPRRPAADGARWRSAAARTAGPGAFPPA